MPNSALPVLVCAAAMSLAGYWLFADTQDRAQPPQRALVLDAASPAARFEGEAIVIQRDTTGQFHLQARINGEDTTFLIDTGADIVALTVDEAERLGLDVLPGDFMPILRTASGTGYGAPVKLERLALGDAEFQNVDAVVARNLSVNLLGQSVLRQLGRVEMHGDRMVIHQP